MFYAMKKTGSAPDNPFLLSGYVSPEYFCDRYDDSSYIIEDRLFSIWLARA